MRSSWVSSSTDAAARRAAAPAAAGPAREPGRRAASRRRKVRRACAPADARCPPRRRVRPTTSRDPSAGDVRHPQSKTDLLAHRHGWETARHPAGHSRCRGAGRVGVTSRPRDARAGLRLAQSADDFQQRRLAAAGLAHEHGVSPAGTGTKHSPAGKPGRARRCFRAGSCALPRHPDRDQHDHRERDHQQAHGHARSSSPTLQASHTLVGSTSVFIRVAPAKTSTGPNSRGSAPTRCSPRQTSRAAPPAA